jgi:hypothetical protein
MMSTFHIKTAYADDDVFIEKGKYHDGSTALRLLDETGQPVLIATVCLSHIEEKPAQGNVFIKDWSENEGLLVSLQQSKIVGPTLRDIPTGFAKAYECELLIPADDSRVRLIG